MERKKRQCRCAVSFVCSYALMYPISDEISDAVCTVVLTSWLMRYWSKRAEGPEMTRDAVICRSEPKIGAAMDTMPGSFSA